MVAPVVAAIMIRWMFNDQFGVVNASSSRRSACRRSPGWRSAGAHSRSARRSLAMDAVVRAAAARGPAEPSQGAFRGAAIDGATKWRVFRYLTLPMLRSAGMVVCIVIRSIDAFTPSTSSGRSRPAAPRGRPTQNHHVQSEGKASMRMPMTGNPNDFSVMVQQSAIA